MANRTMKKAGGAGTFPAFWTRSICREPNPTPAWVDAAAVLAEFSPATLNPLPDQSSESPNQLVALASVCDVQADGKWQLQLQPRQQAIKRLWDANQIVVALDANPQEHSIHSNLLRKIANLGSVDVRELKDYAALVAASEISDWFLGTGVEPLDADRLAATLQRQQQIEPLRQLIGVHFRGRKTELAELQEHSRPDADTASVLVLTGVGGVGKSTILGKLLLDMDDVAGLPRPWAYLDFDNPDVNPTDHRRLFELTARQLSLMFDQRAVADGFIGLESLAAADEAFSFTANLPEDAGVSELLAQLDQAIRQLPGEAGLLLVLDTFEQVQVRGQRTINLLRHFIDQLLHEIPYARVIVSGRAAVPQWPDTSGLHLEVLDAESADQVLAALGVGDVELRDRVIDQVGTSPVKFATGSFGDCQRTIECCGHRGSGSRNLSREHPGPVVHPNSQ